MAKYTNLVQVYTATVSKFKNNPLFGTKQDGAWKWMTYGEFAEQVDALRASLIDLGIKPGDRVSVIANNRPEWAIGAYAVYTLGGAYVPMYEAQHDKEWAYILADSGASAVFVANSVIAAKVVALRPELPALKHIITFSGNADGAISFRDLVENGRGKNVPPNQPNTDDVVGYIYTSGTTGNPKGVLLSHGNFASNVSAIHDVFPMEASDRSLSFLPWAHSFGQTVELHGLFSMGASMGIAESVEKLMDNLGEVQPTLLFSVPRIFNKIYAALQKQTGTKKKLLDAGLANEKKRRELRERGRSGGLVEIKHRFYDRLVFSKVRARLGGKLKYAFSGGAAISKEVAQFIDDLGITVYEGYGLTETSPIATANWPGAKRIGSVGKGIPGVRIVIDTKASGDEKHGEIVVYGPNVMKGYHGLPTENAAVFTDDGGFRTGDLGYLDEDGYLFITGRIKEQYKLENGKYVAPAALEEKLKLSPFVTNAMVYGDNKLYNVALIVINVDAVQQWARDNGVTVEPSALTENQRVREFLLGEIEKFSGDFKQFEKVKKVALTPEDFTTSNNMLTPSLKVKRREVMKRYGDLLNALYSDSA